MNLTAELQAYGISGASVRTFGTTAVPELLDYLDLIECRNQESVLPHGVAESQGHPLLFFVDESHPSLSGGVEIKLTKLRQTLACRGDRAYLARVLPGELKVVPVSLSERTPEWRPYRAGTGEALTFFSRLALGQYDGLTDHPPTDQVFKEMFELLKMGADRLAKRIARGDVLSLVGRALFFRFLEDRHVISERDTRRISPTAGNLRACFDDAENAASTCDWLDRTFNGHFLPLSGGGGFGFFKTVALKTKDMVFRVLSAIVRGEQFVGEDDYQLKFDWNDFDFAHIPVGLLSQVYEKFVWTWEDREARETSVYYTPRNIAATLVDEAFENLPRPHEARILDPACGAGVFLVLAFRRLYRERWKQAGVRPDTKIIRTILERQLTGLDISESALKLAALSLYLTAIELDPSPLPPEKLRFEDLRDTVLFNCRPPNTSDDGMSIGSLGQHLHRQFDAKFDLVLSNPPWTSLKDTKIANQLAAEFTKVSQDIIRGRDEALAESYRNPDNAPDLPFVWKSTQWAKPNGRIAMALPARILLKQGPVPVYARRTLFELLEITGIVNGSNLSDTNVWPEMQQPFMLMFARNRRPNPSYTTRFITPQYDAALNRLGEIRIDSKSAQPVEIATTTDVPWIWKALGVGTALDIDVIRKLSAADARPLRMYWEEDLGLTSGNGYQVKPKQTQVDASHLHNLPNLDSTTQFPFFVEVAQLRLFTLREACFPRERKLYNGPLVLVKVAPGTKRERGWALLSVDDVAFNESFNGFSSAGHPEALLLARYLHLLVHSLLWMHYALLTSPEFGAERRKVHKRDLDEFPVIPIGKLSRTQKRTILSLSRRLGTSDPTVFPEIDQFFGTLYGLNRLDVEVVEDTLSVCLPYNEFRARACQRPTKGDRQKFCRRLESLLSPFFKVLGKEATVSPVITDDVYDSRATFSVLAVTVRGHRAWVPGDRSVVGRVLQLANDTGATRVIQEAKDGLVIAIFNQYRYWTPSRARLLAAEILRYHTGPFEELS
jgi:type I restriction-modification system DNA methylase subunit